jgi:hypothetical protein
MGGKETGILDVHIAKHVVANVAADVELLHAAVSVKATACVSCGRNLKQNNARALFDVVMNILIEIVEIFL